MNNLLLPEFKCLKCAFQWKTPQKHPECPKCKHLYLKWLNYELFEVKYERPKEEPPKEPTVDMSIIKGLIDSTHIDGIPYWTTEQIQDAYKQLSLIYKEKVNK